MAEALEQNNFFVGDCGTETPDDTNGTGSPYKPLATITKAVSLISTMPTGEYTIHVKDGTTEDISSTIQINKNITIECWKNTTGDTLGIATLKWNGTSAGLMVQIISGGTLTIAGDKTADETWSGLVLDGNKSEKTAEGIGIEKGGTLNLNGGAIKNCNATLSQRYGVALNLSGGAVVIMNGGKISENNANGGMGTVYLGSTDTNYPSFTMAGGIICDNNYTGSASYSPGVYISKGSFTMKDDGEITRNISSYYAGGIYISNNENAAFSMTGGKIYSNTAENKGSAIYNQGKLFISGSAYIAPDNDVYLTSGKTITIAGELTPPPEASGITATITPSDYQYLSYPVLAISTDPAPDPITTLSTACGNFAVTPNGTNSYIVNSQGIIIKNQNYSDATSAGTAISGLTTSSAISVSGTLTTTDITNLADTLDDLVDDAVLVSLDLSGSTGLESLDSESFNGCTHLSEIILPDGVKELGQSTFQSCTNLTRVVLPASLTKYNNSIFKNCTNLTEIIIPTAPATIGSAIFYGCSNLISVTLPAGEYDIFRINFNGCNNLKQIIFKGTKLQWRNKAVATQMGSGVNNVKIICSDGTMTYHATSSGSETGTLTDD